MKLKYVNSKLSDESLNWLKQQIESPIQFIKGRYKMKNFNSKSFVGISKIPKNLPEYTDFYVVLNVFEGYPLPYYRAKDIVFLSNKKQEAISFAKNNVIKICETNNAKKETWYSDELGNPEFYEWKIQQKSDFNFKIPESEQVIDYYYCCGYHIPYWHDQIYAIYHIKNGFIQNK